MTDAPLLDVRGLTIALLRSRPVYDLSLQIAAGECLALVGESGSGKSLTALAVMGLMPRGARVEAGTVALAGRDLLTMSARSLRHVRGRDLAMIFQEPMTSLNPVLTAGRQIGEALSLHLGLSARAARARAIELLDLVRVPDPAGRVDHYPHQMSGGMRQRVMIAMAVACEPRLLIADEPTTALDVTIQADMLDLLDDLRQRLSMAVLLITHDLGLVGQWADRVLVIYAGRMVEQASARSLFERRPWHPYTRGLLDASPSLARGLHYTEGPLREIPGSIASAFNEPGCPFVPRCQLARPACRNAAPAVWTPEPGHLVACPYVTAE